MFFMMSKKILIFLIKETLSYQFEIIFIESTTAFFNDFCIFIARVTFLNKKIGLFLKCSKYFE